MEKRDPTANRPKAKDGGDLKGKPNSNRSKSSRPPVDAPVDAPGDGNEAGVDRETVQPERQPFDPNVNQRPR